MPQAGLCCIQGHLEGEQADGRGGRRCLKHDSWEPGGGSEHSREKESSKNIHRAEQHFLIENSCFDSNFMLRCF